MRKINSIIKKIYINSPKMVKEIFASIEMSRRNIFRRGKIYKKHIKTITLEDELKQYNPDVIKRQFNELLDYVYNNIPYYKNLNTKLFLNDLSDVDKLPLLDKNLLRREADSFINSKMKLWKSKTSGSTGTPLVFFRDTSSMQFEYALYDKLYEYVAKTSEFTKIRFSGVNVTRNDRKKPPYWYYIKGINQLQCSSYHIESTTCRYYLKEFSKYKVSIGTGYAKSWLFLSQNVENEEFIINNIRGIVTDSEGLLIHEKNIIEDTFKCPVYQTYGLGEVGMIAVQCKNNHYHIFTNRCYVEIIDDGGKKVNDGVVGEVVVTDLRSYNASYIRYKTGDLASIYNKKCGCGWETPYLDNLCGKIDDYILMPNGKKVGRLGHIAKEAQGVLGMQIVQTKMNEIEIHVLPSNDFKVESMDKVIKIANEFLYGFNIKWKVVDKLEKSLSGKIKYVIRKID